MRIINIDKSFIETGKGENFTRSNIKSILSTKNKKIFLLKECRAELIGEHPFLNYPVKYEYFSVIENDKIYAIRTSSIEDAGRNTSLIVDRKVTKKIVESNINYLSFEKIIEMLALSELNKIFCEIEYEFEGTKYNLISKCEYINYNKKTGARYLQPIMGYVPFILKNQIRYGYVVLNVNKEKNGYLEFLLNEKTNIFNVNTKQNFVKLFIKKILNIFLFFVKKNDFTEIISIKESKINFFLYD